MPGRSSKIPRSLKALALVLLLLMLIAIGITLESPQEVRVVRTKNGDVIKLDRYEFRPGRVRYDQPNRPLVRLLAKVFPEATMDKIKLFRSETTIIVTPDFRNEPVLSTSFSSQNPSGKLEFPGTRVVVSDDRGQTLDLVLNSMASSGVFSPDAFPRRGRELRLHLMDGEKEMAEFRIANPCPGPYPVWKPQPLPVAATNGTLEISLEKFVADAAHQRTRCTFRVRNQDREGSAYLPAAFEISDATGNHWRPITKPAVQETNGWITGSFFGALWPEEEAWKLRVEFKSANKDSKDQTTRVFEFLAKPEQVEMAR